MTNAERALAVANELSRAVVDLSIVNGPRGKVMQKLLLISAEEYVESALNEIKKWKEEL